MNHSPICNCYMCYVARSMEDSGPIKALRDENAKLQRDINDLAHLAALMEVAAGGKWDEDFDEAKALKLVRDLRAERDALARAVADAEVALEWMCIDVGDPEHAHAALERFRNRGKAPTP